MFEFRLLRRALVLGWIAASASGTEPVPVDTPVPDSPAESAARLVETLRKAGLPLAGEEAGAQAVLGAVRTADPGARTGTEAEIQALEADRAGQVFRIGLELMEEDRIPVIQRVTPGGPAASAGLAAGDQLESVEGQYVTGRPVSEIQAQVAARGTQPVRLAVLRPGEARAREVTLVAVPVRPDASNGVERLPRRIEWLRPPAVQAGLSETLAAARADWSADARTGVVLDLRGIGGDSQEESARLAVQFGASGPPRIEPLCGPPAGDPVGAPGPVIRETGPRIVLVDARTRGAAEMLAAALSGTPDTLVLGEPTAGDPLVRGRVKLRDDLYLWVALNDLRTADGRTYGVGRPLIPDLPGGAGVPEPLPPEESLETDRRGELELERVNRELFDRVKDDPALSRAVDILLALHAMSGLPVRAAPPATGP
jgi:carboxyl-terminal processing protease